MPWEGDPERGLEECGKHQGRQKGGGREVSHGKGGAAVRALGWGVLLCGAGQVPFLPGAPIWVSATEQTCFWVYLQALGVRKLAPPTPQGWLP